MPVRSLGGGRYQWGHHGKVYSGRGARQKAERQGAAAYAHGYVGKSLFDRLVQKFSQDQPRVPAGSPQGGEWMSRLGGAVMAAGMAMEPRHPAPLPTTVPVAYAAVAPIGQTVVHNGESLGTVQTPFDTLDVLKARKALEGLEPTANITSPERVALRNKIVDELYGTGAAVKGKKAWLVIGPPGAGKTTAVVQQLKDTYGAQEIDSDIVKRHLPEYNGGNGSSILHEESALMVEGEHGPPSGKFPKGWLQRAIEAGDNIALPQIGKNTDKIKRQIEILHKLGYEVNVEYVHIEPPEAARRVIERWRNGKQGFVDPKYVLIDVDSKPLNTYRAVKGHPDVASARFIDNSGPSPKVIEHVRPAGPHARP